MRKVLFVILFISLELIVHSGFVSIRAEDDFVVNVDTRLYGDPGRGLNTLDVNFESGIYRLSLTNPSLDSRAQFYAWSAWSSGAAWSTTVNVRKKSGEYLTSLGAWTWSPTPQQAFEDYNNVGVEIVLDETTIVSFYESDWWLVDNRGGISVLVEMIGPINSAPILNQIGDKTIDEGELLEFTITATDLDGDELTFFADNIPLNANFDSSTQVFSWTPDFTESGDYPYIHFEVSDGYLTTSEDIMITVNNMTAIDLTSNIINDVTNMDLPSGNEVSLISKLVNAAESFKKDNDKTGINQLEAFTNAVEAQRGKKLTDEQADELIASVQEIIDNIDDL